MSVSWVLLVLLMFMSCRITKSRASQRVQRGLELLAVYFGPEFSQTLAPVPEVPVNTLQGWEWSLFYPVHICA